MEALLSLAFDNIASKDTLKIRKGLRQIEGMLAQICLSSGRGSKPSTPSHRRNASAIHISERDAQSPKKLGQLAEDLAFREFFRLQEGFEWNGKLWEDGDAGSRWIDGGYSCHAGSRLS
jgi:hypothetical protein